MITVSRDQALVRWDTLPEGILDVLVSDATFGYIEDICEAEHIPYEKVDTVVRLVGYVLFGFLSPEGLAKELSVALQIDIRIATEIADAVNNKIFKSLRGEIDKIYQPPHLTSIPTPMGPGPKILEEIRAVTPVGATPPPASTPPPSALPRPSGLPEIGWSRQVVAPSGPSTSFVSPGSRTGDMPPPANIPRPPIVGSLQKTEMGKIPMPTPPPSQPSSLSRSASVEQGALAPVFIRTDAAVSPLAKPPDLGPKSNENQFASLTAPPRPTARPAVIEFGVPPKPPMPGPKPQLPPKPPGM
jgi:hypothetical protein